MATDRQMALAADNWYTLDSESNCELLQELNILKEIYINELVINCNSLGKVESVDIQLHPSTGENVDQKWVCLLLQIIPSKDYPNAPPEICIHGPRGLADEHVVCLRKSLCRIAEDRKGSPVMYELIEFAKESLTQLNVPYGCCMICLEEFESCQKDFTKTECYHYFHCSCLASYVDFCKAELEALTEDQTFLQKPNDTTKVVCPVCREALPDDFDLSNLHLAKETNAVDEKYIPSAEMQELQKRMADLYEKQKQKGGIIDLEEEKNKYLVPKDYVFVRPKQNEENLPEQDSRLSKAPLRSSKMSRHSKNSGFQGRRERQKVDRGKELENGCKEEREKHECHRENTLTSERETRPWCGRGRVDQALDESKNKNQGTDTLDQVSQTSLTESLNNEMISATKGKEREIKSTENHDDATDRSDGANSDKLVTSEHRCPSQAAHNWRGKKSAMRGNRLNHGRSGERGTEDTNGKYSSKSSRETERLENQLCSEESSSNCYDSLTVSKEDVKNQHRGSKPCFSHDMRHRNFNYSEQSFVSSIRKKNDYRSSSNGKVKFDGYTGQTWHNRNHGHHRHPASPRHTEQNPCRGSQRNDSERETRNKCTEITTNGKVADKSLLSTGSGLDSTRKSTVQHSEYDDVHSYQRERTGFVESDVQEKQSILTSK